MSVASTVFLLLCATGILNVAAVSTQTHASLRAGATTKLKEPNPMRQVITMLQQMEGRVETEVKTKQRTFDDENCQCITNINALERAVQIALTFFPVIQNGITETEEHRTGLEGEKTNGEAGVRQDETDIVDATNAYEKKRRVWGAREIELRLQIDALERAIRAIQTGNQASFLQTNATATLMQLTVSLDMSETDRQALTNFITGKLGSNSSMSSEPMTTAPPTDGGCRGTQNGCCPQDELHDMQCLDKWCSNCKTEACMHTICPGQIGEPYVCPDNGPPREINGECCKCEDQRIKLSGAVAEIVGVLKALKDELWNDLVDLVGLEAANEKGYDQLVDAKKKDKNALQTIIGDALDGIGEDAMSLVAQNRQLDVADRELTAEEKELNDERLRCQELNWGHGNFSEMASQELAALGEAIKVLSDDDALELFKKTIKVETEPEEEDFLQLRSTATYQGIFQQALRAIKRRRAQAAHHKADPRVNLILMAMHGGKNQGEIEQVINMIDVLKTTMAKEQTDDDNLKAFCDTATQNNTATLEELDEKLLRDKQLIKRTNGTINTLKEKIAGLEKTIDDDRKNLAKARETRLKDKEDYQHNLALNTETIQLLERAKTKLQEFYNPTLVPEAINTAAGIGGASFLQESEKERAPYAKQDESSVIEELDRVIQKQSTKMEIEKVEESQAEDAMASKESDAGIKKRTDDENLENDRAQLAEQESELTRLEEAQGESQTGHDLATEEKANLYDECAFLLKYYKDRQAARTVEMEGLDKAKAILKGADFNNAAAALVQTKRSVRHLRGHRELSE